MPAVNNAESGLSARGKINDAIAKTDLLTITQAVDLDAIETRVNALDAAVILKGTWDASAGTFPGGGTAQAGESWIVSVAGTVNGVAFAVDDRVIAIADNASTATFAANWHKADYTDLVTAVAGLTGSVSAAALTAALNAFTTTLKGLVPASGGGTTNFLRADGTWAAPAGGGGATGTTYHNGTGGTLTKGTPVCLAAFDGTSGHPGMATADADGSGTMPAVGILSADVANGANAVPAISGDEITGLNTSAYALGDRLYVSTGGALTNVRPVAGFIQAVAVVSRVDAVNGEIIVSLEEAGQLYTEYLMMAASDETTDLTTGTAKITFWAPFAMVITKIKANVINAPTGSAMQIDVNEAGVSIFSTPITIDAGEDTSETAATAAVISDGTIADNAKITVDIDQVGSTVAGRGLKLTFYGFRA